MYNYRRRVSEPGAGASGLWMNPPVQSSPCRHFDIVDHSSFFPISTFDKLALSRATLRTSNNPSSLFSKGGNDQFNQLGSQAPTPRALNRRRRSRHTRKGPLQLDPRETHAQPHTHTHAHTHAPQGWAQLPPKRRRVPRASFPPAAPALPCPRRRDQPARRPTLPKTKVRTLNDVPFRHLFYTHTHTQTTFDPSFRPGD